MPDADVVVLGAGVIGLTTAVALAEAGFGTTVVAEEIPGRTSLAAGASWGPYLVEPRSRVNIWSHHTLTTLTELAAVPDTGVRTLAGIEASRTYGDLPPWTRHLPDVQQCRREELPPGFLIGWRYSVPVVDMPRYLAYLLRRLRSAGGTTEQRHVTDIGELTTASKAVVNCGGLGARQVTRDNSIYPVRGQLVVMTNPGVHTFFSEDTGNSPNLTHYLPHGETVILGGTALPGEWNREPDPETTQAIVERCTQIQPRLSTARVLEERVGLRPTRSEVRLEVEHVEDGLVIHNYGHGGAGLSLSWGSAMEVLRHLHSSS